MWSSARLVAPGDTLIVWLTRDNIQPLVVDPARDFNTKFGNFRQDEFVGVPYGSKVAARSGRGFVHLLRPTPELWTLALPHRTQILYLADIAFITAFLHIVPGSTVVEAGTGSASFSHSVARTVGPKGRLFSYEFHEPRYIKAQEEFARHGMDAVHLAHRNVCKDGFTITDEADAVFLDLPAPWEAVPHAKSALRKDRPARICCFSPCIEQVLRTVAALNDAGFTEITTYETLLRPHEVFQTPALPSIAPLAARLKLSEVRREEKRQRQISANRAATEALAAAAAAKEKEETGNETGMDVDVDVDAEGEKAGTGEKRKHPDPDPSTDGEGEGEGDVHKRPRTDAVAVASTRTPAAGSSSTPTPTPTPIPIPTPISISAISATLPPTTTATTLAPTPTPTPSTPPARVNVAKALAEVRGHTSYLTFATLAPLPRRAAASAASSASAPSASSAVSFSSPPHAAGAGGGAGGGADGAGGGAGAGGTGASAGATSVVGSSSAVGGESTA